MTVPLAASEQKAEPLIMLLSPVSAHRSHPRPSHPCEPPKSSFRGNSSGVSIPCPPGTVTCFQAFAGCSGVGAPPYKEA